MAFVPRFVAADPTATYAGVSKARSIAPRLDWEKLLGELSTYKTQASFEDALKRAWEHLRARQELYNKYADTFVPTTWQSIIAGAIPGIMGGIGAGRAVKSRQGMLDQLLAALRYPVNLTPPPASYGQFGGIRYPLMLQGIRLPDISGNAVPGPYGWGYGYSPLAPR